MRRIVLASALLLPLVGMAQSQTPPPPGGPGVSVASYDGNRAQVRDRLQLTEEQSAYWERYEASLDAYSKLFYEEKPLSAYAADAAPRQFARMTDSLQNRLAALEDIERSAKELYAVLSDAQRKIATRSLVSTVPVFASAASCVPTDSKPQGDKRDASQRGHHGGGMGGMGGAGGGAGGQGGMPF